MRPTTEQSSAYFPGTVASDVLANFPYGVLLFGGSGRLERWNPAAKELLPAVKKGVTCCDLLECRSEASMADDCFIELLRGHGGVLPEVRVDLAGPRSDQAAWVTASVLASGPGAIIEVRPGDARDRRRRTVPHWAAKPQLRIYTFGPMRVVTREGPIGGDWLGQRPGQILKHLVCQRHHTLQTDAIAEAIWPESGVDAGGTVRHFVHALRHSLEPDLPKRAASAFVVSRRGGYALDLDNVSIDADDFARHVSDGRAAFKRRDNDQAKRSLAAATALYMGDFLADEPYAQWALDERERLRNLACDALRTLATIGLAEQDLHAVTAHYERLSELLPYDLAVQRRLIAMMLATGHHSEAARRYHSLRMRMSAIFDEELTFDLAEIEPDEAYET